MKELINLYEENYDSYLKQANRSLGDLSYAEDCVQEAFENAIRYFSTYKGPCIESWFSRVFRNTVRDYLSYIKSGGIVTELKYKDHPVFPEEIVDRYKGVIEWEIERFSKTDRDREILTNYFLNGYGAKLSAISSECSESVVYTLTHRFRNHLVGRYEVNN